MNILTSTISNNWFTMAIIDDCYYKFEVLDNVEISIDHIKEIVAAQKSLGGRRLPMLVLFSKYTTTNADALKYISDNANFPYSAGGAYVISSLSQRLMANFYLKLHKPMRPTRFFNTKEDALKWVKELYLELTNYKSSTSTS